MSRPITVCCLKKDTFNARSGAVSDMLYLASFCVAPVHGKHLLTARSKIFKLLARCYVSLFTTEHISVAVTAGTQPDSTIGTSLLNGIINA